MDLRKAKILLEKINVLHKSMSVDEEHIAEIEKDLMRNYIRQLYECYLNPAASDLQENKTSSPRVIAPVQKEQIPAVPVPPPVEEAPPVVHKRTVIESPAPSPATPKPAAADNSTPPVQTTAAPVSAGNALNGDFEPLFEFKEAKELSERLSQMPIKDLTKAMGLNERILTINELFGGNKKVFEETMNKLNNMKDFEEAKVFLAENIASQYEWINKEKKQKAKLLIKLIRRRYL